MTELDFALSRRRFLQGAVAVGATTAFWDLGASYKKHGTLLVPQEWEVRAEPVMMSAEWRGIDLSFVIRDEEALSTIKCGDIYAGRRVTMVDRQLGTIAVRSEL